MNQKPTYSQFVAALVKSGEKIQATLTPERINRMHAAIGISGEGGELLDAIKKEAIYNKPLDLENVKEELGDLEFYMEQMRQAVGLTREECIEYNRAKLVKRYEGLVYTDQQAHDRNDKK